LLVYDIVSHPSFAALPTFLNDARALASPNLTLLLVGNKSDLASGGTTHTSGSLLDAPIPPATPSSVGSKGSSFPFGGGNSLPSSPAVGLGTRSAATIAPEGREVLPEEASRWASDMNVPVCVETSAYTGDNVDEVFNRLARMILTKIELGEVDPDDPQSGIQYGDSGAWGTGASDGGSIKSGMTVEDGVGGGRRRRRGRARGSTTWMGGMREWEGVFRLDSRRRKAGCC
jgi:GTPase SAR1 family protein